jgi:phosphoglycerate kinase
MIKYLDDAVFDGKNVLVRVDFNVPLDANRNITDTNRIDESLKTINAIIEKGGIPVLMSHLGRPKGKRNNKYSLKPVAEYLREHYGYNVIFAEDCIGETAKNAIQEAHHGDIVLLENLRFYKEEEQNDIEFAKKLAELGESYVNDAFGTAHRAHASTYRLATLFTDKYAGYLLEKEIHYFETVLNNPKRPFVVILGGSKLAGKIYIIHNLNRKCDTILIGGAMMFTFLKAMQLEIGKSIVDHSRILMAARLMDQAKANAVNIVLPIDVVVADEISENANKSIVDVDKIPSDKIGLDIGPKTVQLFRDEMKIAQTILWNGPMGVFEIKDFAQGTFEIAKAMAEGNTRGAITIVGGGDSAAAIKQMGLKEKITHVSTGGGASLEYLQGIELPAITALKL